MSEILIKHAIQRESGYLYYIDGEGSVCRSKMNRDGRKATKKKGKAKK